jgi:site-specific recombinase XerD
MRCAMPARPTSCKRADIRLIQELLGHARLDSTAIYTRIAPMDLKIVHARFHPMGNGDAAR